jgi:hypothetical protein
MSILCQYSHKIPQKIQNALRITFRLFATFLLPDNGNRRIPGQKKWVRRERGSLLATSRPKHQAATAAQRKQPVIRRLPVLHYFISIIYSYPNYLLY